MRSIPVLALAGAAFLSLVPQAHAGVQSPGSLLVFPCFDNNAGSTTIVSVTNTNTDSVAGGIKAHFIYVNGSNCQEFNRIRTLTANDTITVLTQFDNPNQVQGYLYCYAQSTTTGAPVKFDYLVGTAIIGTAVNTLDTEVQPFVFKAAAGLAQGQSTDVDSDGIRDLNGNEYEQAPDKIVVPSFLADTTEITNKLVLINLTGGSQFTATIDLQIFNDNEEAYSGQYSFSCWKKVDLITISGAFSNSFLKSSNQNTNEIEGTSNLAPETGWFRINGLGASSGSTTFADPAILALRLTQIVGRPYFGVPGVGSGLTNNGYAALPFGEGLQPNGDLLPHGPQGDSN